MHPGPGVADLVSVAVVGLFLLVTSRHRVLFTRRLRAAHDRVLPPPPVPAGRPIQEIAADARRLRARFHDLPTGTRFAKYEGIRGAYDRVLAEGCTAVGHPHLLTVVRPGDELDAERERVEDLLDQYGFHLQDVS